MDKFGGRKFIGMGTGISPQEGTQFTVQHKHSGQIGDGDKIPCSNLDTSKAFANGDEPVYTAASGNKYRIQIIEVLDENNVLAPVLQIVPVV